MWREVNGDGRECLKELVEQFVEIARKYFGSDEELVEFYDYFISSVSSSEFGRLLELEARKVGIVPSLKGSPLYIKKINAIKEAIARGQKFYVDIQSKVNKGRIILERFEIEGINEDYAYASGRRSWVIAPTEVNKWYSEIWR